MHNIKQLRWLLAIGESKTVSGRLCDVISSLEHTRSDKRVALNMQQNYSSSNVLLKFQVEFQRFSSLSKKITWPYQIFANTPCSASMLIQIL